MIIAQFRHVLILMICPQLPLSYSIDYSKIDWELCKDIACFVPGECGGGLNKPTEGVLGAIKHDPSPDICDITLITKMYSERKWLIVYLYNGSTSDSSGFDLTKGSDVLFGCKTQQSVVTVSGKYNPELVTGHLSSDYLYCEFTISAESKLFDSLADKFTLTSFGNQTESWSLMNAELSVMMPRSVCDPSAIIFDYKGKSSDLQLYKVESLPLVLTCKDPSTQTFVYVNSSGTEHENARVECDTDTQKYNVTMEGEKAVEIDGNFTAYCSSKACMHCSNVSKPSNCRNCITPTFMLPTNESTCAQLKCDRDLFDINGALVIGKPECISTDKNEIKWQINNIAFTEAACRVNVDCHTLTPLTVSECATCEKVDAKKDEITCSPSYELRVQADDRGWHTVSKIKCDRRTSEWKAFHGSVGVKLFSTTIQCYKPEPVILAPTQSPSVASPPIFEDPRSYVGTAIGFTLCLLIVGVIYLICFVRRKRAAKRGDDNSISKRRSRDKEPLLPTNISRKATAPSSFADAAPAVPVEAPVAVPVPPAAAPAPAAGAPVAPVAAPVAVNEPLLEMRTAKAPRPLPSYLDPDATRKDAQNVIFEFKGGDIYGDDKIDGPIVHVKRDRKKRVIPVKSPSRRNSSTDPTQLSETSMVGGGSITVRDFDEEEMHLIPRNLNDVDTDKTQDGSESKKKEKEKEKKVEKKENETEKKNEKKEKEKEKEEKKGNEKEKEKKKDNEKEKEKKEKEEKKEKKENEKEKEKKKDNEKEKEKKDNEKEKEKKENEKEKKEKEKK